METINFSASSAKPLRPLRAGQVFFRAEDAEVSRWTQIDSVYQCSSLWTSDQTRRLAA